MKKNLIRIIPLFIAITLVLSACSTVIPPSKTVRWLSGETLTYEVSIDSNYTRESVKGSVLVPYGIGDGGSYVSTVSTSGNGAALVSEVKTVMDIREFYSVNAIRGTRTVEEFKEYVGSIIPDIYKDYYEFKSFNEGIEIDGNDYLFLRTYIESFCKFTIDNNALESRREVRGGVIVVDSHVLSDEVYKAESVHLEFNDYKVEMTSISNNNCNYTVKFNEQNPKYDNIESAVKISGTVVDNNAMLYVIRSLDMAKLIENTSFSFNMIDLAAKKVRAVTLYTNIGENDSTIKSLDAKFDTISSDIMENKTRSAAKIVASVGGSLSGDVLYMYFDTTTCDEAEFSGTSTESKNSFVLPAIPGVTSKNRLLVYKQNYIILKLTGIE